MFRTCLMSLFLYLSFAFAAPGDTEAAERPVVFASNYPLYYFAGEIAGSAVDVRLPDISGDPAYWAPNGDQVAELQAADRVLLNGAGYEGWLDFISLREERLVDTTAGLGDKLLPLQEATVHQHGPGGAHSHEGTAFTTWLDPSLATEQARAIAAALIDLSPKNEADFRNRLASLETRLEQLDTKLERTFESLGSQPVVFSHPVYQYLQSRYDINGRSVHWEPGAPPGTRDWIDLRKILAEHPARILVWEAEPLVETQKELEALGIESVTFDPAGNKPEREDYFEVMERNLQALRQAL